MQLRVLFIARKFPPSVGGMERFAFELSEQLKQKTVLHPITWGGSNKWLPVILPIFLLRASWALLTTKIDVIHIQDGVMAPIGWLLHVIFRKPYIIVAHGLDITYDKWFYQSLILPFVRRANHVISISSATNQEVLDRGMPPDRASVVGLGVHDDYNGNTTPDRTKLQARLHTPIGERIILLTTGRLVRRKGVEWFISNVLPSVVKEQPSVLYVVVGDGAERGAIQQAIDDNNLGKVVLMAGRVDDETRSLLYRSSDLFIMPNIVVPGDMEGFGIVAHEAAVAGLPVVASNLEGIKDAIVDGKNGLMVTSGDSQGFREAIDRLVSDKQYRQKFGQQARRYTLKEYSWERIAEKYHDVYDEITK